MKTLVFGLLLIVVLVSLSSENTSTIKMLVIGLLLGFAVFASGIWLLQSKSEESGGCLAFFIVAASTILLGVVAAV